MAKSECTSIVSEPNVNTHNRQRVQYTDLHRTLYDVATRAGVEVHFGSEVVSIDPSTYSVRDAQGNVYTADLLVGADGALGLGRKVLGGDAGSPSVYSFYAFVQPSLS